MIKALKYDLIDALLQSGHKSIMVLTKRDLLGQQVAIKDLWWLPEPKSILRKQNANGSWSYPSSRVPGKRENYHQYETFKQLGILVEKYGFNKSHPAIKKTADYFFAKQSGEGDFRGIYDKQYSPNYSAAISELLIKTDYDDDTRIEKQFKWLISMRQEDGGWALPFRTRKFNIDVTYDHPLTIQPDKTKSFSSMISGVVLRAFAAHPKYKNSNEAKYAAKLILPKLFEKDTYPDRKGSLYWLRFAFPFCYTDLISVLDSLSLIKIPHNNPYIEKALDYFVSGQDSNGLWNLRIVRGRNKKMTQLWLALAIGRIFKRFRE